MFLDKWGQFGVHLETHTGFAFSLNHSFNKCWLYFHVTGAVSTGESQCEPEQDSERSWGFTLRRGGSQFPPTFTHFLFRQASPFHLLHVPGHWITVSHGPDRCGFLRAGTITHYFLTLGIPWKPQARDFPPMILCSQGRVTRSAGLLLFKRKWVGNSGSSGRLQSLFTLKCSSSRKRWSLSD